MDEIFSSRRKCKNCGEPVERAGSSILYCSACREILGDTVTFTIRLPKFILNVLDEWRFIEIEGKQVEVTSRGHMIQTLLLIAMKDKPTVKMVLEHLKVIIPKVGI